MGSYFFLGEIYTDLDLINDDTIHHNTHHPTPNLRHPVLDTGSRSTRSVLYSKNIIDSAVKPRNDGEQNNHCGNCEKCLNACPTKAITAPYQVDAKRCIAYLTLEYKGIIPEEMRPLIGNRIYGCDDCQLCCPWNSFAKTTQEPDFNPRHNLDNTTLIKLFSWSEEEFLKNTEGSAIRRIGYECWQRNIAVALGNAAPNKKISALLISQLNQSSPLIREHITWSLNRYENT
ncbi:MAG: tRNA epoxyqueuosine(34) reductase QueG [Gammaproteobacteria bacterium]|nr:tRNA epoxyqueuosine(34) reductase QueG [Gammaproteobacteria bacterium]